MTTLLQATPTSRERKSLVGANRGLTPPAGRERGGVVCWVRWGIVLVLGGLLVLAHGCHADKDNELFARKGGAATGAAAGLYQFHPREVR